MTPIRTMYHVSGKSCKIDHTFSINFDPSKKWLDGRHGKWSSFWFHTKLLGWWLPPNSAEWKKTPGLFPIFYSGNPSTWQKTIQFLNYTEIWWNFRVGISLDELKCHTKLKCPKKLGRRSIMWNKILQGPTWSESARFSWITEGSWKIRALLSSMIESQNKHPRFTPKSTVFGFPDTSRFILPQVSTCAPRKMHHQPLPTKFRFGIHGHCVASRTGDVNTSNGT